MFFVVKQRKIEVVVIVVIVVVPGVKWDLIGMKKITLAFQNFHHSNELVLLISEISLLV